MPALAVRDLAQAYRGGGYGVGHRVALLLDNRLEHLLHKLALNSIGACCVPINPDYRPRELSYLIDHARIDLCVLLADHLPLWHAGLAKAQQPASHVALEDFERLLPAPSTAASLPRATL